MLSPEDLLPSSVAVCAIGPVEVHEALRTSPGQVMLRMRLSQPVAPAWQIHFAVTHLRSDPPGAALIHGHDSSVLLFESAVDHDAVQRNVDLICAHIDIANELYALQVADRPLAEELGLDKVIV